MREERIFFYDNRQVDAQTGEYKDHWYFNQKKVDAMRNVHSMTLHYESYRDAILRISNTPQAGMKCEIIGGQELANFVSATGIYYDRVIDQIYGEEPVVEASSDDDDIFDAYIAA